MWIDCQYEKIICHKKYCIRVQMNMKLLLSTKIQLSTHSSWINVLHLVFHIKRKKNHSTFNSLVTHVLWQTRRRCCSTCKVKVWKKINFCFAISAWWNRQQEEWKDWNALNEKKKKMAGKVLGQKENGGTIRWHRKKRIGKKTAQMTSKAGAGSWGRYTNK